jgi:hypothetical protein
MPDELSISAIRKRLSNEESNCETENFSSGDFFENAFRINQFLQNRSSEQEDAAYPSAWEKKPGKDIERYRSLYQVIFGAWMPFDHAAL